MMDAYSRIPPNPQERLWDVVVIGTGAGGAAAGFNLARRGRSVLFVERGPLFQVGSVLTHATMQTPARRGWWPDNVYERTPEGDRLRSHPVGCGAGGSTALFAMVMDRFRPIDLTPRSWIDVPGNCSLPEAWPITYGELAPYYDEAEALFRVRGTQDALTREQALLLEPPPQSRAEIDLERMLAESGLHPYRVHYAREAVPGCTGCPARLCTHECRNDASRICLIPALDRHNAYVVPQCQVVTLGVNGRNVVQAECLAYSREVTIRGKVFVLALGALQTPALLLRSKTKAQNNGLGNSSDLVGRNLMAHVSDTLFVTSKQFDGVVNKSLNHGLALNDFYIENRTKLGNVHAHAFCFPGSTPEGPQGCAVFNTIVEDFPYRTNRVVPKAGSSSEVVWEYQYPEELRVRARRLVEGFANALVRVCEVHTRDPIGGLNMPHACGTCRFGDGPKTSVLDRNNRIHDLDNAYVVDASFFPSSSGIHPSLTIVANSLRVSDVIARNCF
jgi:choline dehydrogenase-like flavoprotein